MQQIDLVHDGVGDLIVTVNGDPIWASGPTVRTAAGIGPQPLPNDPDADPATTAGAAPLPGSTSADPDIRNAFTTLARQYGIDAVQRFIRTVRHNDNGPTISDFLAEAAANDIHTLIQRNPGMSYEEARKRIGEKWGYKGTSLSNFNKIADRGWFHTQSGAAA